MRVLGSLAEQEQADTTAPSIPQNVSATAINKNQVDLSWDASTDDVGVSGYQLFRDGAALDSVSHPTVTYSDTTVLPNTLYGYTVAAFDAAGNTSAESTEATATTPANAVPVWATIPSQDLIVSQAFNLDLDVYASDADVGDTLTYSIVGGTLPTGVSLVGSDITGTPTVAGESSTITVRASDGTDFADTNFAIATFNADVTAPPVPTGLESTAQGSNTIDLIWNASVDAQGGANEFVSGTANYKLYRDGGLVVTQAGLSFNDTGLQSETQYAYTVSAVDAEGNESAQSTAVNVSTTALGGLKTYAERVDALQQAGKLIQAFNFDTPHEVNVAIDENRVGSISPGFEDRAGADFTIRCSGVCSLYQTIKVGDGNIDDPNWGFEYGELVGIPNRLSGAENTLPDPAPMFGLKGQPGDYGDTHCQQYRLYWEEDSLNVVFTVSSGRGGWKIKKTVQGSWWDGGTHTRQQSDSRKELTLNNAALMLMPRMGTGTSANLGIDVSNNTNGQTWTDSEGYQHKGRSDDDLKQNAVEHTPNVLGQSPSRMSLYLGDNDPACSSSFGCNLGDGVQATYSGTRRLPAEILHTDHPYGTGTNCKAFAFAPNQWITFTERYTYGDIVTHENGNTVWAPFRFEMWAAYDGKPSFKIMDHTSTVSNNRWYMQTGEGAPTPPDSQKGHGQLFFTPFMTNISGQDRDYKINISDIIVATDLPADPVHSSVEAAPTYVSSLAANEVKRLTATNNGVTRFRDAAGAAWQANPTLTPPTDADPQALHLSGATAFSGGFGDMQDKIAYLHGGGHGDSAYNGIIGFDFKGGVLPNGFFLVSESANPQDWNNNNSFINGFPASVHSYDQMCYNERTKRLYRIGESIWSGSGGRTNSDYECYVGLNGSVGTWQNYTSGSRPNLDLGAACIYDPLTNCAYLSRSSFGLLWDIDNNTWQSGPNHGVNFETTGVWCPSLGSTGRGYALGKGTVAYLDIDFYSKTHGVDFVDVTPTGDTGWVSDSRLGAVWDPQLEVIWIFCGRNTAGRIWRYDPVTNVSTELTLTGDDLTALSANGTYKRFVFVAQWGLLGIIGSDTDNAYAVKLR